MSSLTRRKYRNGLAATVIACGLGLVAAVPASATTTVYLVGNNSNGEALNVFYNSNCQGAVAYFYGDVPDYAGYETLTGSGTQQFETDYDYIFENHDSANGHGQAVKNNAASVTDYIANYFTVYYNSGYAGHSQTIISDDHCYNLDATLKNNNASQTMS